METGHLSPRFALPLCTLFLALALVAPPLTQAQDLPAQRQIRTYIPPDQLVSFLPSTPFDRFIEFLDPVFERVSGKRVIDPETRTEPIGVSIAGMHFMDALELVLGYHGLAYRETDRFFLIEEAPDVPLVAGTQEARAAQQRAGAAPGADIAERVASLGTREIQINAVLFDLNVSKARELGIDWNVFFGGANGGQGGSGGGAGGSEGTTFHVKTDRFFDSLEDVISAPDQIEMSQLTQFFRLLESEGLGETVANPQINVLSGEQGRIQIGSDVPVQVRDFAGNTITQFFSTGIIVDVTPTLVSEALADTAGAPVLDFVHLDVLVEKSSSRPSAAGPVIDRNTANTRVAVLNGEQTVIGGLYSTEESLSRRGIPLLKDLPGWFFGLRYVFGYTQKTRAQKELLIVLQARVVDDLPTRAERPFDVNLLDRRRRDVEENLRRFSEPVLNETRLPSTYEGGD